MTKNQLLTLDQPAQYHLSVVGRLGGEWSETFDGMQISVETRPDGLAISHLTGRVPDQAGLHGLLRRIRDLGLPLLKVEFIENQGS